MGPVCNNYGTFVVPSGCSAVQIWRDDSSGDLDWNLHHNYHSTDFLSETETTHDFNAVNCRLRRKKDGGFGVRLGSDGGEAVVLVEVDDDIARVRGLCVGNIVTHVDGRALLGSLRTAVSCVKDAKDTMQLRIQVSAQEYEAGSRCPRRMRRTEAQTYRVIQHLVRQGDSIENLAAQLGTTTEQIRSDNRRHFPVGEAGFLRPGQILMLRAALSPSSSASRHAEGTASKASHGISRRHSTGSRGCGADRQAGRRKQMLYEVQEGDSLEGICARLGAKEAEVRRCNRQVFPVGEAGTLVPGQMLTMFATERPTLEADDRREDLVVRKKWERPAVAETFSGEQASPSSKIRSLGDVVVG